MVDQTSGDETTLLWTHLEAHLSAVLLFDVNNDSLLVLQFEAGLLDEESGVVQAVGFILASVAIPVAVANVLWEDALTRSAFKLLARAAASIKRVKKEELFKSAQNQQGCFLLFRFSGRS